MKTPLKTPLQKAVVANDAAKRSKRTKKGVTLVKHKIESKDAPESASSRQHPS